MKRFLSVIMALSIVLLQNFSLLNANQLESKISSEVYDALETLGDEDELSVYVLFFDIDHDAVMERFATLYPEQFQEYNMASESDIASSFRQPVNGDINGKENYTEYTDMSTIKSEIESSDFVFACDYTDDEGLVKLINCYDELVACGCNVVIYDLGRIGSRELLCNLHESHEITHMETLAEIDAELNDAENDE